MGKKMTKEDLLPKGKIDRAKMQAFVDSVDDEKTSVFMMAVTIGDEDVGNHTFTHGSSFAVSRGLVRNWEHAEESSKKEDSWVGHVLSSAAIEIAGEMLGHEIKVSDKHLKILRVMTWAWVALSIVWFVKLMGMIL